MDRTALVFEMASSEWQGECFFRRSLSLPRRDQWLSERIHQDSGPMQIWTRNADRIMVVESPEGRKRSTRPWVVPARAQW